MLPRWWAASARAGIPDTYFTIPAHCRVAGKYVAGWIAIGDDEEFHFHRNRKEVDGGS